MNLNKKYYLPITTWNKKHSSKQAVPITYTWKSFLPLLILKVCETHCTKK